MHNIDRDNAALHVSQSLAANLGYHDRMTFACEDVSIEQVSGAHTNWASFDVVFLAALVGMNTAEKVSILEILAGKMRPGTLVVVRSAQGLRSVLYPVSMVI